MVTGKTLVVSFLLSASLLTACDQNQPTPEANVPPTEGAAPRTITVALAQAPETMEINQAFPVCLEAQMLGGNGTNKRPTGNLCTPGLHVTMADTLVTEHCISADAPTFHGEEWISFELYVYGDSLIQHLINGKPVISYSKPVIGGGHLPENYFLPDGTPIEEGYISLQSESHPIEFKDIYLRELN